MTRQRASVGVTRELFGMMAAEDASGFVVISSRFTEDAKAFAQGKNLQLIEGAELNHMIRKSRATAARQNSQPAAAYQPTSASPHPTVQAHRAAQPTCPTCRATMVQRVQNEEATPVTFLGYSQSQVQNTRNEMPA